MMGSDGMVTDGMGSDVMGSAWMGSDGMITDGMVTDGMSSNAGQQDSRRDARRCGQGPLPAEGSVTPLFPGQVRRAGEGSAGVRLPTVWS